jgi:hypothetical protein
MPAKPSSLANGNPEHPIDPKLTSLGAPDPFDPAALRINPDFEAVAVKRKIVQVAVRKPKPQEFVRVHPDERYRLETAVIELAEERETYLVAPALLAVLADEVRLVRLHLAISRGGGLFFWPVPLPGPDGRRNPWHEAAEKAALEGRDHWVRLKANMAAGTYDVDIAAAAIGEPDWPELSMSELLKLAFGERMITSLDHPVVKRLRGLA